MVSALLVLGGIENTLHFLMRASGRLCATRSGFGFAGTFGEE
jgi:hypothetical protein